MVAKRHKPAPKGARRAAPPAQRAGAEREVALFHRSVRLADHMMAFPASAQHCTSHAELAALTTESIGLVGMTAVASGMITGPRVARGELFHFNTWPIAWLDHYERHGFMDRDPIPRWAIVSGAPARWSDVIRGLAPSDPAVEVIEAADRFGFREGVVTPVRTAGGHLGLVSAGGADAMIDADAFHFLVTICTAVLHRADALDPPAARLAPPHLSRREQECVTLLVQGLTEREISERLGIGEVTARFHLDNARLKTGARSRTHLAGIAGLWLGRRNHPAQAKRRV